MPPTIAASPFPLLPCSVRYGSVADPATLEALLTGRLEGQQLRGDSEDEEKHS